MANAIVALILNVFFPGAGEIYLGQVKKGIIMLVAYFGIWVVSWVLAWFLIGFCCMIIPLAIWIYGLYDAFATAGKINRGEAVRDWLS
jgi:TM2 domain-containing membrane protein YozV